MALSLTSPSYQNGAPIPSKYTCEGEGISPPLAWESVPSGTKSFALTIEDPDAPDPRAPRVVFLHWLIFNIPGTAQGLAENAAAAGLLAGAATGRNDFGGASYGPPCPPVGRHRYVHRLYALDAPLQLTEASRAGLQAAMQGHVLATAELIGTYQKGDR